jgi:hypothetical protein
VVISAQSESVENKKNKKFLMGSHLPEKKFGVVLDYVQQPFKVLNFSLEKNGYRH